MRIDRNKPLQLVDKTQRLEPQPVEVIVWTPDGVIVKHKVHGVTTGIGMYDYNGVMMYAHSLWTLENIPPAKVKHTRYVVWFRVGNDVRCIVRHDPPSKAKFPPSSIVGVDEISIEVVL